MKESITKFDLEAAFTTAFLLYHVKNSLYFVVLCIVWCIDLTQ